MSVIKSAAVLFLFTACGPLPPDSESGSTTEEAMTIENDIIESTAGASTSDGDDDTGLDSLASTGEAQAACPGEPCSIDADCAGNPAALSIIPRCADGVCAWQCTAPHFEDVCGQGSACDIDADGNGSGLCSPIPAC